MREKLIELVNDIQQKGVIYTPSQMDERYGTTKEISNEEIADNLIANGVTIQKWIPVSERLPEDMLERVLVTTDCDTPVGNQRIDTDRYRHGRWVRYGDHVTHWMPLPEPPKEE